MSAIARAVVFFSAACVFAQSKDMVEAASVGVHMEPLGQVAWPHILISGNRISVTAKLSILVALAYELDGDSISATPGLTPGWDVAFFDVTATSGGTVLGLVQARAILRQVLADQFQLKTHWEPEQVAALELTVGEKGIKFQESAEDATAYGRAMNRGGTTYLLQTKRTATQLAFILTNFVGQPVVDKTGLRGVYDFTFAFKSSESKVDDNLSAIAAAVEDQLGLKLAPSKLDVTRLVIDHVEWPRASSQPRN